MCLARLLRAAAALCVLLALTWFPAAPAGAHATLTLASPEPESTSTGVPDQIQLHFRLPAVPDERTSVSVMTPSGRDLAAVDAVVTGLGVAQPLTRSAETGWYQVRYRVVFWGGHVDSGGFRFQVTAADHRSALRSSLWVLGGIGTVSLLCALGPARRRAARWE